LNTEVTLTAIPRPAFQFIHWLGDVAEPTRTRTTAYLDRPKIIIAVFDVIEVDTPHTRESGFAGGSGGGGLVTAPRDYGSSISSRAGGGTSRGSNSTSGTPAHSNGQSQEPEPPTPPEPPIPEPATGALLLLGTLMALARRSRK